MAHQDELIERGEELPGTPTSCARYRTWVEGLTGDWNISRQRYFGVPFSVWYPVHDDGTVERLTLGPYATLVPARRPLRRRPDGLHADPTR